ncbi:MAG: NUDIX domain-containing protein [Vicinamibacterales bacterium]
MSERRIAELRPASTVVVLRPSAEGSVEVLLVKRNDRVAFMAGAYVFPGGRVDEADRAVAPDGRFLHEPSRFQDLSPAEEHGFRVAAVRELAEEANVVIGVDDLVPFAHWVTPEIEIRRYDTRFFLAVMPAGQEARHDDGEMTELAWLAPSEAIDQCRRGQIMLPPPTWTTLRRLERHGTVDEAVAWARRVAVVRVMPGFVQTADESILTLPGDPTFPAIEGWEVPEETRFVLKEGRGWLPQRA